MLSTNCFTSFLTNIEGITLPDKFTFPFAYEPHTLSRIAAEEVQEKLSAFKGPEGMAGKMFGVLIVQKPDKELGFLVAFSGQEMEQDYELVFVPPIADRLQDDGFFNLEKRELLKLNKQIENLENSPEYLTLVKALENESAAAAIEIKNRKEKKLLDKAVRQEQRERARKELTTEEIERLEKRLKNESIEAHYSFNRLKAGWKEKITQLKTQT